MSGVYESIVCVCRLQQRHSAGISLFLLLLSEERRFACNTCVGPADVRPAVMTHDAPFSGCGCAKAALCAFGLRGVAAGGFSYLSGDTPCNCWHADIDSDADHIAFVSTSVRSMIL